MKISKATFDQVVEALTDAVHALNVAPRFTVADTDSYAIASQCDRALGALDREEKNQ